MNIVFNKYFSTSKRLCDDIRCKGGIINYNVTTYFNNFLFPEILIFLIDTLDFKTLKKNYIKIKSLFNQLLIVDEIQYDLIGYYLMPFQNHFIVLFKNQIDEGKFKKPNLFLFDDLYENMFELNGDINQILDIWDIHAVIYMKTKIN